MRKLTSLWIALMLLILCASAQAEAPVWAYDAANLYLKLEGGLSGDVIIPGEVDGCIVTAIENGSFQNQNAVTSLTMPSSLRALQGNAVSYMDGLTNITLNDGLEVIGNSNFSNLKALTSLTIPGSVRIVDGSISFCDALKEVRFEGACPIFTGLDWCFLYIPDDCVIYVPDDQMDAYAAALENANGAAQRLQPSGKNTAASAPNDTESWFEFDASTGTITGYTDVHAFIEIPESIGGVPVQAIARDAFRRAYSVYGVVFPEGLEHIDTGAFQQTSNMIYVKFPSTLTVIGDDAFMNAQMRVVEWSEGLTEIGARAFQYHRLSSCALPSTVEYIGESAFAGGQLTELYLGENVKSIGSRAFAGNAITYMAFDLHQPIEIAEEAFAENSIRDLDLPWDTSFESRDAYAALIAEQCPDCTVWINNPISGGVAEYPVNQTEITAIENGVWISYSGDAADLTVWTAYDEINVTALGDGVFKGNQTIRSFYPHHCGWFTTIGAEAFADSTVEKVEMFGSITEIGDGAFRNCVNITELTIPASVTKVGTGVLTGCTNLKKLIVLCDPAILPEDTLAGCSALEEVYVAADATDKQTMALGMLAGRPWYLPAARLGEAMPSLQVMPYEPLPGDDFWSDAEYARLDQYNGYEVNLVLPREIDDTVLTMIGGTMMSRASFGDDFEMELPVRSVVIPETYQELTYFGFQNCETLETVVCYAPIENLPDGFFSGCTKLREVVFVNGVRNIGRDIFMNCPNLKTVYLGEYVENVDEFAFRSEDGTAAFALENCITSADHMPDVDALLSAVKSDAMPAPAPTTEPVPVAATPIGAEGEAFFGTWYGISLEMEGETFSMAEFGMDMRITLNADGTAELFDGEEMEVSAWTLTSGVVNIDGMALTLNDKGELCTGDDSGKMFFAREAADFTPTAIGVEGEAFFGTWYGTAVEMGGNTYSMTEFGMNMRITLNADGTVEMADGDEVKNLTWTYADGIASVGSSELRFTEDGRLCLEDNESSVFFSREATSPAPVAIGAEGEPFFGTWYGVTMEEDGTEYSMSELGVSMWITLYEDGTAEMLGGEGLATWTLDHGVATLDGMVLTLMENGELCMEEDGSRMFFRRDAIPQDTPDTTIAAFDLSERLEKKYVMASADVQGMSMTPAMLGGYEYSLIFHEMGSVDFTMAGAAVPNLTWTQSKVMTDDGEKDALIIDYYGTPLNVIVTEEGFDMNYFDSMTIHFAAEE